MRNDYLPLLLTEKQLKEFGDKLPADKKAPIEAALNKLKEAHKAPNLEAIDKASAELTQIFQAASQEMYNQTGGQQQSQQDTSGAQNQQSQNQKKDDEVTDVDFEEVK